MTENLHVSKSRIVAEIPNGFVLFAMSDDLEKVAILTNNTDPKAKKVLTVNGVEVPIADMVSAGAFTRSGALSFTERKAKTWRVRIGEHAGRWFERVRRPTFSPDGSHHVYGGREDAAKHDSIRVDDGWWVLVLDGAPRWPEFNADSEIVRNDGQVAMVVDREPIGKAVVLNGTIIAQSNAKDANFSSLAFSPDGTRLAYHEEIDANHTRAVCGDYESEVAEGKISSSGFSPTGDFYHGLTTRPHDSKAERWLVIGKQRIRTQGAARHVLFREDGTHIAHIELTDSSEERLVYSEGEAHSIPSVVHVAHHPSTGKIALVCLHPLPGQVARPGSPMSIWFGGKMTERYDSISAQHFRFMNEGSTLQFIGKRGNTFSLEEVDTSRG